MSVVVAELTWRQAAAADEPLLLALFSASKAEEFAPLGLSGEQLKPLLAMQFQARQLSYRQHASAASDMILCLADGTPVGRHLLERQPDCYRTVDIAVLPEYRGKGIATWTLRQTQQLAALERVTIRLRVDRANPALALYERLGFLRLSSDELAFEMEWSPRSSGNAALINEPTPVAIELSSGDSFPRQKAIDSIFAFLREIGLTVELGQVPEKVFLPGIQLVANGLRVDIDALKYPGDLLHEAGHLAVMTPARRDAEFPNTEDAAEEMAAMAWSYAAALHLDLPPELVFHEHGYRGQSATLLEGYRNNSRPGLPILWWIGLTTAPTESTPSIYPKMTQWLRTSFPPTEESPEEFLSQEECNIL